MDKVSPTAAFFFLSVPELSAMSHLALRCPCWKSVHEATLDRCSRPSQWTNCCTATGRLSSCMALRDPLSYAHTLSWRGGQSCLCCGAGCSCHCRAMGRSALAPAGDDLLGMGIRYAKQAWRISSSTYRQLLAQEGDGPVKLRYQFQDLRDTHESC